MRATYELTRETRKERDITLYRIMALPGNKFAAPGTLGGWIEKEENLQDGAWVADNACVYGNAQVRGNSLIADRAQIYGNAIIDGSADELLTIEWDLKVHGGYWTQAPYYGSGGIWTINISSPDSVRIGCRDYTFERWKNSYKAVLRMYRLEAVDTNGIKECVNIYNRICHIYGKDEFLIDVNDATKAYRITRAETILSIAFAGRQANN